MSGLIKTIGSLFNPVLDFFRQVWEGIVFVFNFLWDLISGLYYGFNTIISHLWDNLQAILGISFISDNSSVIAGYTEFLGFSVASMFNGLLLITIFLICLRFVWSLLPFFKK